MNTFGILKNSICIAALFCSVNAAAQTSGAISIIPQPVSVATKAGTFSITKKTVIAARDEDDRKAASLFNDYLKEVYGFKLDIDRQEHKNYIRLNTKKFIQAPGKDAYTLNVTKDGVSIDGDTYNGTFYGMQTLIQLLPETRPAAMATGLKIPFVTIQDYPRFGYRGMHLDVCRHFFPVSFVKRYIDYLALHKMNYFHWHLTDDQGWRIEINKYPKLIETGAWRNGTVIGRYPGTANDNLRYGGYYTKNDIRSVVQYALDRHITVIPEIEMPGHSSAAIASYPYLSCFPDEPTDIPSHPSEKSKQQQAAGMPKQVQETWGVFNDVYCAGKDSTFAFLQDVLNEVMPLFPSNYIHVGGDESPKGNWKRCPNCQARIKALGLKDEHELQSYFIQRIEKYVNSKGKKIIGWDEILEGGLAPNATVMSWRGEQGGIDAAKQKHDVIMTPQKPVYFDHTQTKNEDSLVIGGYNPIEAVYAYEPVPKVLDSVDAKHILGAQANLWTEYIANERKVEYMIFPRMSALSEVLWSPKENRNWDGFAARLQKQFRRYNLWGANYSKAYYDIKAAIMPANNFDGLSIEITPRDKNGIIKYTTSTGTANINYTKPFMVTKDAPVQINYYRNNALVNAISYDIHFNKATGKKVTITKAPNEKYPGQPGAFSLVNGIYSNKGLSYPDWLGWIGDDIEAVIDLGKKEKIDSVRLHTINQNGSWIYLPEYVEVSVSNDGKNFKPVNRSSSFVPDTLTMGWINVPVSDQAARYIKVFAKNYGTIPMDKAGGGTKAWVFADEIQIY